ncbi:MAG TPA: hypothetical protein VIL41_08605 [Coriobacteriia bacterium]
MWAKTNRLGERTFMVVGVLAIIGAFPPPFVGIALILAPAPILAPVT